MSKNKANQYGLDLDNHLSPNEDERLDFVLKINEGHLIDLEISTVSILLSSLAQIVNIKEARFNVIQEGSTTVAISVPKDYVNVAISNITIESQKNHNQIARIQKELKRYGYGKAVISYGKMHDGIYKPYKELLNVKQSEEDIYFSQIDCIEGRVTRLQVGKDHSDHITIILNNGRELPAECPKNLLMELHQYFNQQTFLRFTGMAHYIKSANSFELKLKKYSINTFKVIDDIGIDEWVNIFRRKGSSEWNKHDNPIVTWIKERED